ncbi:MAG: sensor histidine kinase [Spirochaetota bacterium]
MQIFDDSFSNYSLQRWVALLSGSACAVIVVINSVGLATDGAPLELIPTHPTVLFIAILALMFFLSGANDSRVLRGVQIAAYLLGGVFTAIEAPRGDLTSSLFAIFGMLLYNEYGKPGGRTVASVVGGIVYVVFLMLVGEGPADPLYTADAIVFVSAVVALYGVLAYRQTMIRRKQADELEIRVQQRTAELREAVLQRDTMLQEIHHRVGNSLQLLASFVSLQQEGLSQDEQRILRETELRVHAIADVHATLYSHHQLSHLPLYEYAYDLVSDMQIAYHNEAEITLHCDLSMEAHIDFAVSFGIIMNELVTNATKHGRTKNDRARIEASLAGGGGDLILTVRDSGTGFSDELQAGIGTEVVDELVRQNDGSIERRSENGAMVEIVFPLASVVRDAPVRAMAGQPA